MLRWLFSRRLFQDERLLDWLISHGPPLSEQHRPGIESAAQYAPMDMVQFLLSKGASFKQTDAIVLAAIGHIKRIPDRLKVVRLLVEYGAPFNAFDLQFLDTKRWMSLILTKKRMTGLHHAASDGKTDLVEFLLELGAESSVTTFDGEIPRDLASKHGHEDIVQLLNKTT